MYACPLRRKIRNTITGLELYAWLGRTTVLWLPAESNPDNICVIFITSPPEGVARYCFHPVCLSVCVCVCVSGQNFGILFLGY